MMERRLRGRRMKNRKTICEKLEGEKRRKMKKNVLNEWGGRRFKGDLPSEGICMNE